MNEREKELEKLLLEKNIEIAKLHSELVDIRLDQHDEKLSDHESRLRTAEVVTARSNLIFALTTGGGLVSAIVLIRTLINTP